MRIALEARALAAPSGGVRRYVEHLARELAARGGHAIMPLTVSHALFVGPWLQWRVPRILTKMQPDVVHFTKADVPRKKVVPTVVTIYDVIPLLFPASQKVLQRWYWPGALKRAAHYSDAIITISEASKRDIVDRLHVDPRKVTVTMLAVDTKKFTPQNPALWDHGALPYILFVGTLEPRKNVPLLIRAFARIANDVPHRLVIAGKRDNDFRAVQAEARASRVADRIEFKNFVSHEELVSLYEGAELFTWPSVYEGWGLPPLEALAQAVPTIVSDGGSLPEVVGEAGVIVPFSTGIVAERTHDTAFEGALAEAMRAVLTDPARREALRAAGPKQAGRFSWRAVAEETLAVYKKVAERTL